MSDTAEPTLKDLILEVRDELKRLRTLLAELRPMPIAPGVTPGWTPDSSHSPLCPCVGMWHGITPAPCTCGADSRVPQLPATWETTYETPGPPAAG